MDTCRILVDLLSQGNSWRILEALEDNVVFNRATVSLFSNLSSVTILLF